MILMFPNPKNKRSTGVLYLQSMLYDFFNHTTAAPSRFEIIKRFFSIGKYSKNDDVAVFLPLSMFVFFARKGDIIILPDDSIRSISSVAALRLKRKSYIKFFVQILRLFATYIIFYVKKHVIYLTVSVDDLSSLRKQFPKIRIEYLPHPIQAATNSDAISQSSDKLSVICFMNLQEHYSVDPEVFFSDGNDGTAGVFFENLRKIYFHGAYSEQWLLAFQKKYPRLNAVAVSFVDDFDAFFSSIDLIVVPLAAGAGIKNIVLNSLYRNKIIVGTSEAFSGLPVHLTKGITVSNFSDLLSLLNDDGVLLNDVCVIKDLLRDYVLSHNSEEAFHRVLNKMIN